MDELAPVKQPVREEAFFGGWMGSLVGAWGLVGRVESDSSFRRLCVWCLARQAVHAGSSGIVWGYVGLLLALTVRSMSTQNFVCARKSTEEPPHTFAEEISD